MSEQIPHYIRECKSAFRQRRNMADAFASVRDGIRAEVDIVQNLVERQEPVIPELDYQQIAAGNVDSAAVNNIKHRGCVIVRNVFSSSQASEWNDEIGDYVDANNLLELVKEKDGLDQYFSELVPEKPQIYGIYWSRPQVMARQAESMARTKRFLNNLWDVSGPMGDEFDPDHDFTYADRIRRRSAGDTSFGLTPHMDSGSYERWLDPAYQKIYEHILFGDWENFDPWRARFRTQTRELASPAVCSMFRTFQGWTALTRQGNNEGTLQLLPIARSIAYILLRALQDDVPDDELCLATPGRALGVDEEWHPDIMPAIVPIPEVQPGDTVWWHQDLVHAVSAEHNGKEDANVIYIASSPVCPKNAAYALKQAVHFTEGRSAPDFSAEDYEVEFANRATVSDLTALGKRQMGIN